MVGLGFTESDQPSQVTNLCVCVSVKVQKSDHPHAWDPCVNYCHPPNSGLSNTSATLNKSWTASNNNTINSLDYCKCKSTGHGPRGRSRARARGRARLRVARRLALSCFFLLSAAALVSASFSPGSTTTSGPSSQSSSTLPRPTVPMSPRNSLLKRRQRKKEHKSSRKRHRHRGHALRSLGSNSHVRLCMWPQCRWRPARWVPAVRWSTWRPARSS